VRIRSTVIGGGFVYCARERGTRKAERSRRPRGWKGVGTRRMGKGNEAWGGWEENDDHHTQSGTWHTGYGSYLPAPFSVPAVPRIPRGSRDNPNIPSSLHVCDSTSTSIVSTSSVASCGISFLRRSTRTSTPVAT